MNSTPVSLLHRLQRSRDTEAWSSFVSLYAPLLFRWGVRLKLQDSDIADLVQDVLVILFRKLPEFEYDPNRSFRSWLQKILNNRWLERKRKATPLSVDGRTIDSFPQEDPLLEIEEKEYRQAIVRHALNNIRGEFEAKTWQAFEQYVLQDKQVREVASTLGLRPGTIYAAKSRVLMRLRQEVEGLLE